MNEPIKAGDLCEVISGVLGLQSPNIGLVVEVLNFAGDDPAYGRIWRCSAEFAEQWRHHPDARPTKDITAMPGTTDFAQDWLKKIEPPSNTKGVTTTLNKELNV